MKPEDHIFSNHNVRLAGTLFKPESDPPYPALVVVHPASEAGRSRPFYQHLKSELPQQGIAVFLFDRRGSGASGGDFETADFETLAGDVVAAVEYLQSRPDIDENRVGLHGTSQGGWIAPIAAARKRDIAFLIAVSASGVSPAEQMNYGVAFHLEKAGFDPAAVKEAVHLRNLVNEYFRGRVARGEVQAALARFEREPWYQQAYLYPSRDLPADITQSKWHYEMDYEPLSVWQNVRQPVLFLFAEVDEWVPIEESMTKYRYATSHLEDVTLQRIQGTDHLMRNRDGDISGEYLHVMMSWLKSRIHREP